MKPAIWAFLGAVAGVLCTIGGLWMWLVWMFMRGHKPRRRLPRRGSR